MSPAPAARSWLGLALLAAAVWLQGCASFAPPAEGGHWSGRLALSVLDGGGAPQAQSAVSASFQLDGTPATGSLSLSTPIGSTLAVLRWQPGKARLEANGKVEEYPSLDALAAAATGTPLPVAALFDWLDGRPTAVPGWTPDLSRLADGRISARRTAPLPQADLRVVLER